MCGGLQFTYTRYLGKMKSWWCTCRTERVSTLSAVMSVSRDLGKDFGASVTPGLLHETLPSSRNQRWIQGEPAHLRTRSTTWLCITTTTTTTAHSPLTMTLSFEKSTSISLSRYLRVWWVLINQNLKKLRFLTDVFLDNLSLSLSLYNLSLFLS